MVKASIFINYKIHRNRFSSKERSEETSFDTEEDSFIEAATEIIDVLEHYVRESRLRRR